MQNDNSIKIRWVGLTFKISESKVNLRELSESRILKIKNAFLLITKMGAINFVCKTIFFLWIGLFFLKFVNQLESKCEMLPKISKSNFILIVWWTDLRANTLRFKCMRVSKFIASSKWVHEWKWYSSKLVFLYQFTCLETILSVISIKGGIVLERWLNWNLPNFSN